MNRLRNRIFALLAVAALAVPAIAAAGDRIDINTATAEELTALPRIGPALAERIVKYREEHGPFSKVEELLNVSGIGEKTFAVFADRITVGGDEKASAE